MLYLYVVVQLGLLVSRKLPLYKVPDPLPRPFGGRESEHLARAERGNEFDDFLVRFHESIVARSSDSGKEALRDSEERFRTLFNLGGGTFFKT